MNNTAAQTAPAHEHAEHGRVEPLPACLAPRTAARELYPDLALPAAGEPVILRGGHVTFLQITDPGAPATRENTQLWGVAMCGYRACGGAAWDDGPIPLDPDDVALDRDDAHALAAAYDQLIAHAATAA